MSNIPQFPRSVPLRLQHRDRLQRLFAPLIDGVAEFTFANLYLFRRLYRYRLSSLSDSSIAIKGKEGRKHFWLLPQGLPPDSQLQQLLQQADSIKCVPQIVAERERARCRQLGLSVKKDRDNFDYLYLREEMAILKGRKFHKKRNFVNYFQQHFKYEHIPLRRQEVPQAFQVLRQWRREHSGKNDWWAARRALHHLEELGLSGYLTRIDGQPCGYSLGEELAQGTMYVVHFEKATIRYRGIFQFINKAVAEMLPERVIYINREQDLGDEGLRQAKMTYRPAAFVEKYRIRRGGIEEPENNNNV